MDPAFLLTALVVCLVPGTGVVYTVAVTLGRGRRAGLAAAAGCTLGPLPHLAAAILGLAAAMHASALMFQALKWAGVLYLLWLGWGALRGGGALAVAPERRPDPLWRIAGRGTLLNVLNPKLSIFFLALLPPFVDPSGPMAAQMAGLGALFMGITFATFVLYVLLAGWAREAVLASDRVMAWTGRAVAGAMTVLAGRLALERA
ncbi:threonine/homoserine/homoserine lactone efflux protein [Hasllibacter halocynthiae]|uniref:Threonine/homoserine/homoserine lactone efflux protein n=1 Tax=Hasllibacter halocynthiae TaxID=595589 RepID=A0A2T0X3A3_9RHOB|nr:LysE family translocator [Hasllibacter halocynthiae]PRY93418.1 threonine/homoserine/homoserine lactone efflux protein [Hasllibacter halocynthiae]